MPQTLQEYADWLDNRNLIWPKLPAPVQPKATPSLKPLRGIRAVTWSLYGTLLRIADGRLLQHHPQQFRMQVALEKTIEEFNMWHSMSRKPGAPWEYMLTQYTGVLEKQQMRGTKRKGDFPEVDSSDVWRTLIERLVKNEYTWDESMYGDLDDLSLKVAYFFHMRLQGVEVAEHAVSALNAIDSANVAQALLADAQPFSLVQMLRAFRQVGTLPPSTLFGADGMTLSYRLGVRKPSKSIYRHALQQFQQQGISPQEVLHVGARLGDDLAEAKRHGMKTVLFAGDAESVQAGKDDIKNPETRPDRLMTDLNQIGQILGIA
ncbi:MAG: HAD hydrolase-like protein [Planctomycetaceae bacterium]|jgi:FMN phosphatase YigB (HAD superfamily)|nr:HAD hydrolase-like protein [Planctomycetaceae bacterium]MBT6155609.1 HAD hydrolase-like protein [Planctomycetaceae bacterium]MBT6483781.1 HAD hydrolase-like protein [Planctomycetaceae bacterium]MBT6498189.1 HAD hydrolase-like protein [Planctomycetaceae bacterium]